tara:strand:- start:161 stop:286 length:126 start_codon:yes stop_codon:yes gene_type:complete
MTVSANELYFRRESVRSNDIVNEMMPQLKEIEKKARLYLQV